MKMSRVNGIGVFSTSVALFLFHSFRTDRFFLSFEMSYLNFMRSCCYFCLCHHFDAHRIKSFWFRMLDISSWHIANDIHNHAHKFVNYDKKINILSWQMKLTEDYRLAMKFFLGPPEWNDNYNLWNLTEHSEQWAQYVLSTLMCWN